MAVRHPSSRQVAGIVFAFIATLSMQTTATAQTGQQRGATFGGLAGAIAGSLIGDHNNEAGAGAAIGGVVGAVAGGILGNASDKDNAIRQQQRAYQHAQQQRYYQQQQAVVVQSAVTIQDVVNMSRSGLSDQVIVNQIRQRGYVGTVAVADIIALHQQGVSENVITTLQTSGSRPTVAVARPAPVAAPTIVEHHIHRPAPVVVEQHVLPRYPTPRYHRTSRYSRYYHH